MGHATLQRFSFLGRYLTLWIFMGFMALPYAALAANILTMGTTTGIQDSGLLDYLKPLLLKETGIDLKWLPTCTDKALEYGKNCDVDVLFLPASDVAPHMLEKGAIVHREAMQYSVIAVTCPKAKAVLAKKFADWWVSAPTRDHIAAFQRESKPHSSPDLPPPSR